MTTYDIPLNVAAFAGREMEYMRQAVEQGHISGDGPFTKQCETLLAKIIGAERVLLTTSCTDALEMSAMLLDIQPGDEAIVPSFTFVSTINAFVLRGARPVFIDVRPDTLNLDERLLEQAITPRTKVILPVHYAGVGCDMDTILEIAARHSVAVVEDNAHGLFGRYRGRSLGSFGAFATQSFHETKNLTCGEGGALVVNDRQYAERAEIIREKGTDRTKFSRGQVDKYTWVDVGSSHLPSDLLAAFLLAQLEGQDTSQRERRRVWETYASELRSWAGSNDVELPFVPEDCEQPYHLFYMLLPTAETRDRFIAHMREERVLAAFHYLPLHQSPMGQHFGGRDGECPVTEDVCGRLVRLPFYTGLSASQQERVIAAAQRFAV